MIDQIMEHEDFRYIGLEVMPHLAPKLSKVPLSINSDGTVDPVQIAKIVVNTRCLEISMKWEVLKLTHTVLYIALNPIQLEEGKVSPQWIEGLCKYLHNQVEQFIKQYGEALDSQRIKQESKIVLPGQHDVPRIRPR